MRTDIMGTTAIILAVGCGGAGPLSLRERDGTMPRPLAASWMLEQEARALLTRLALVRPLVLDGPMVPAAALLPAPQLAIEHFLATGRKHLHGLIERFLDWLRSPAGARAEADEAQQRF